MPVKHIMSSWLRTVPGILVSALVAITILAAFGGRVFDVFRTPARVEAIEIEVRGHHDTLQIVFKRVETVDSIHAESHEIQRSLRDIGFMLCEISSIPTRECMRDMNTQEGGP